MKGKGLLIAAAVIQLVGAAFMLIAALSTMVMAPAIMTGMNAPGAGAAESMMRIVGLFYLLIAGFTTWVSIKLIQRRRWAWIVSLVMACLFGALMLVGMIGVVVGAAALSRHHAMGLGMGEAILLFIFGTPVYVIIGLLIGGRSATDGAAAPRA